jgi:hypothetical protein
MLTVTSVQNFDARHFSHNSTLNERYNRKEDITKDSTRRFVAIVGMCLALIMPINRAFAQSFEQLSGRVVAMGTLDSNVYKPSA